MTAAAPRRYLTREADELVLEMIRRRFTGETVVQVGTALGVTPSEVARRTNEVKAEDLSHPDPRHARHAIARAYW